MAAAARGSRRRYRLYNIDDSGSGGDMGMGVDSGSDGGGCYISVD